MSQWMLPRDRVDRAIREVSRDLTVLREELNSMTSRSPVPNQDCQDIIYRTIQLDIMEQYLEILRRRQEYEKEFQEMQKERIAIWSTELKKSIGGNG